jgi:hypothetical protein
VQRQAGVDHVLDDEDVPACDLLVQILQEADAAVAAGADALPVARELDEVDPVRDLDRTGEIRQEDEARLQRRDEERLAIRVVACDLASQLRNPGAQLLRGEVCLADAGIQGYDARSRW